MALQRVSFPPRTFCLYSSSPRSVEGFTRTSDLDRSSFTHPTSSSRSSSRSVEDPHDDVDTLLTARPVTTVTFRDAHELLSNSRKMLQEWNIRWGTGASFSYRATNAFLGIGPLEIPADRTRGEILDLIRKGRRALLQLESIAFIDLRSIKPDEFQGFWIEAVRVIEGLNERVTRADVALQPC
jgi:hypothetical protein